MTEIILVKTLPISNYYTGSGATTINLAAFEFIMDTKKSVIKIVNKKTKSHQNTNPTDEPVNKVVDLQSNEETIVIRAWLDDDDLDSGTATSGSDNSLTDSGRSWTTNAYKGFAVTITGGTGIGQSRIISSNTSEDLIVSSNWVTNPNSSSTYTIIESAWNKAWKLRAMVTRGGPLTSLTIGTATPLIFPKTPISPQTETNDIFLENNNFTIKTDDTGDITASRHEKPARIECSLAFYIGKER